MVLNLDLVALHNQFENQLNQKSLTSYDGFKVFKQRSHSH